MNISFPKWNPNTHLQLVELFVFIFKLKSPVWSGSCVWPTIFVLLPVCGRKTRPPHFPQTQTALCERWLVRGRWGLWIVPDPRCSAFERSFGILSFVHLFCTLPLHHQLPSFSAVGWWVCLFVWIQSDTASPPAYRHTDSEITSQWQRLGEGGGGGTQGETDVQTEDWQWGRWCFSHINHWLRAEKPAWCNRWWFNTRVFSAVANKSLDFC